MKQSEWKELFKKCFGKEKEERYHAVAMLIIYVVIFFMLIISVKIMTSIDFENELPQSTAVPTKTSEPVENELTFDNYSYSYTITYNDSSEFFLGKKVSKKEKFTYMKEEYMQEYAKINENFLILEENKYHIAERPSRFFKYCDINKLISLLESDSVSVSNKQMATLFGDSILMNYELTNSITKVVENSVLKSIDLNLSNYIASVEGTNSTLMIHMEFAEIGTTEDFEIKMS